MLIIPDPACMARLGVGCLLCLAAAGVSARAADAEPVDVCEVFQHPELFLGKTLRVRGIYLGLIHGAFIRPYHKCGKVEFIASAHGTADTVSAWTKGGGFMGAWMLSIMKGRFEQNPNGGFEFYIESLVVLRRVKVDDKPK